MRTADQNISHGKEKNFLTDVWLETLAKRSEAVLLPLGALIVGLLTFGLFLYFLGKSPFDFYALVYKAGFGTSFSWQNTLSRTAPLLFAALCVALPARLGLMVIGGRSDSIGWCNLRGASWFSFRASWNNSDLAFNNCKYVGGWCLDWCRWLTAPLSRS